MDSLQLPESIGDQRAKRIDGGLCVDAGNAKRDARALPAAEQQHAHDALRIGHLVTFAHFDVRLESIREIDELRGGPRVEAQAVWNLDRVGQRRGHEPARWASRCDTTTS